MRKAPVVLKPLGSRKSQVSNILGVRRQENSPAFEVRDQAALDWQKVLRGAPCTVWLKLALIRPSQELLVSYRPLARLGLTRQKRAVAPRAGRRFAWKLCATRHNSPEAWTNARLLCAPPQPLPPPSQRVRFGSRRAARAADEPAAEPAADEPAAAAAIDANHAPLTIDANQGVRNGRQKAGRQV